MAGKNNFFDGLQFQLFGNNSQASECADRQPLFYGVQYVHSGSFYLSVDHGKKYSLHGPAAFLTVPGINYSYGSPAGTSRHHCHVCFNGERVQRYLSSGLFIVPSQQQEPFTVINNPQQFLADMLELLLMLQNGEHGDFAVAKLEYILLSIQHQAQPSAHEFFHQPQIEELARRIMTHPQLDWDFKSEAEKLHISLKHFMRIFQAIHKHPPHRFVLRQRIFKAQELLLKNQSMPVKAIAYECGFNNEFYFSRVFKKYMHYAPETFRKKHIKIQL